MCYIRPQLPYMTLANSFSIEISHLIMPCICPYKRNTYFASFSPLKWPSHVFITIFEDLQSLDRFELLCVNLLDWFCSVGMLPS